MKARVGRGQDCDHPSYPEYYEKFGEDPARFLYHFNPLPRIRGIQDRDLLDAYLDVELQGNRRKAVIGAINSRIIELEDDASVGDQPGAAVATDGGDPR